MTYLDDVRWRREVGDAHPPLYYDHFLSAVLFDLSGIANDLDKVPRLARIVATCQIAIRKEEPEAEIDPDGAEIVQDYNAYRLMWSFIQTDEPGHEPTFNEWWMLGCTAAAWLDQCLREGVR